MRPPWENHSNKITCNNYQKYLVFLYLSILKSHRIQTNLIKKICNRISSLEKICPLEKKKYYQEAKMERKKDSLKEFAVLELFCEVMKVNWFWLGEFSVEIVSH